MAGKRGQGSRARHAQGRPLGWTLSLLKRYRAQLAAALALGFAAAVFSWALMFASGRLISAAAHARGSILTLYVTIIYVRVLGGGKPVVAYVERLVSHSWVLKMTSGLRLRLYRAVESIDAHGGALRPGEVLGALSADIGHLQNLYLRSIFPAAIAWALYLAAVAAAGRVSPALAAAFAAGCAVACIAAPAMSHAVNGPRERRRKRAKEALYTGLADQVLGLADWVCSGRRTDYLQAGSRGRARVRSLERAGRRFDRARDLAVQSTLAVCSVAVLAWAGARFGGADGAAAGAVDWIAAFVLGFFPLADTFAAVPGAVSEASGHMEAVGELQALDERAEGMGGGPASGEEKPTCGLKPQGAGPATQPAVPASQPAVPSSFDIEVRGMSFSYPGTAEPVLDDIDLSIPHGRHLAILGRSAAGKSTLAALLRGELAPDAGSVTIGGVSASSLSEHMSDIVGVVPQDTYLFNTTLYDNMCVARATATREEVMGALARVGLKQLVESLPHGLDTVVDEGGMRFSGGERHRIAIARVLLRDTPIVLLDEPFASLDPITERGLLATLLDVFADRTLIMVTHHLLGIEAQDRVVFIEGGRVELSGTPASLAVSSPRYRRLLAFDRGL